MTARAATESDIDQILPMLGRFHQAAGLAEYAAIEPATLRAAVGGFIHADQAHVFVSGPQGGPTGTACIYATTLWFNRRIIEATELWWWVEPHARKTKAGKELLGEMAAWAMSKGASLMQIGTMDGLTPNGRNKAYERLGYRPIQRFYIKRLR